MSTTIKRIALVAVAALGLGVMSVAPSTATTNADTLTLSAATATQLTSETATATSAVATLSYLADSAADSMSVTVALVSGPAGNTKLPRLLLVETSSAQALETAGGSVIALASTTGRPANTPVFVVPSGTPPVNATAKFRVFLDAPTVVGTYVVRVTPAVTGVGVLNATAQTLTITVSQNAATDTVVSTATSIINAGETASATADVVVTASRTADTTVAAATIKVATSNAAAVAISSESITATISGPGILGSGPNTTTADLIVNPNAVGRAITVKNGDVIQVFPDGTSGVSTVTISSAAGKILATETLTFFGAAATITTTVKKAVLGKTAAIADVLEVVVKDSAGVSVSNLTSLGVVSSDTTKIATLYGTSVSGKYSTTTGAYLVPVTPVAAGVANVVVTTKTSSTGTGIDAAAVSLRVGSSTPASVAVTTDKSSYAPGEKATITVKLLDAAGLEVAGSDTYTAIFATGGIKANYSFSGSASDDISVTGTVSYADGGKTYAVYMPVTEGDVTFSWTTGTGLATANQAKAGSVVVEVTSPSTSAAIDAANEAATAAQDATDAAIQAADAADEATAAVAALALEVNTLIAGLKKQLTTLTNLVIKLQKSVNKKK